MQQLHRKRAAMTLHRSRDIRESFKLRVIPKSGKTHRRVDRVLVDEMTAENDHSQTGSGPLLVVSNRLFGKDSFVRRANPCWTDRGESNAIRKGGISNPQRRKQMRIIIGAHLRSLDATIPSYGGSPAREHPVFSPNPIGRSLLPRPDDPGYG